MMRNPLARVGDSGVHALRVSTLLWTPMRPSSLHQSRRAGAGECLDRWSALVFRHKPLRLLQQAWLAYNTHDDQTVFPSQEVLFCILLRGTSKVFPRACLPRVCDHLLECGALRFHRPETRAQVPHLPHAHCMRASVRDARVYVTGEHACAYRTRRDVTLAWQMQPRRTYLALLLCRFLAQPLVLRKELREQTNTTAPSRTALHCTALHCTGTTVRPTAWRTLSKRAAAAEPSLSAAVSASEACKAKQSKANPPKERSVERHACHAQRAVNMAGGATSQCTAGVWLHTSKAN